jgi:hypothetical protein
MGAPADYLEKISNTELTVRTAVGGDLDELLAMYARLPDEDVYRRFFASHAPPHVLEGWLHVAERRGELLVVVDAAGRILADAGYVPISDGSAELAITVDPSLRGWMAPYLLDVLARRAAAQGLVRLEAEVLTSNCAMLALLRARGCAFVPDEDLHTVRAVIATEGAVPGFLPDATSKVVVERTGAHWRAAAELQDRGHQVLVCPGPGRGRAHPCPLLSNGACPLVDEADAVVVLVDPDDSAADALIHAHRARASRPVIKAPAAGTSGDVVAQVDAALTSADDGQPGADAEDT